MGANREQGWSLLVFVIGFTFFVAGLFVLGPISWVIGLLCLIAAAIWFYRLKPLEHLGSDGSAQSPGDSSRTKWAS
jgi:hypothetical protein